VKSGESCAERAEERPNFFGELQQNSDYSITSLARAMVVGRTSKPSALAVLRLIATRILLEAAPEDQLVSRPLRPPLRGDEVRALRELRRQFRDSTFVFATERGGPFTPDAVNRLVKRIGVRARFAFPVHAHMLRHACGYALANAGHDTRRIQDWLGHRSIQHTTRYTQLSAAPFKDLWR
jgi:integrase